MSPAFVFLGVVLLGCAMSLVSILVALSQPQIDLPRGAVPVEVGGIEILPTDLIEEPDQLGTNAAIAAFRERQSLIRAQLDEPRVEVAYRLPDDRVETREFEVRARQLSDLPWAFWFQIVVGLVSLFIGGWIIALRPGDWGARMFALTALFVPVFAQSAAIYSTRQIALDGGLFHTLSGINALGAVSFGIALVGLFSQYPKPMFRPVWLLIPAALYSVAIVLSYLGTGPDNIAGMAVLSQMLIALVLGTIQWFRSRREPLNRAGLRWFILVSLVGCSLFVFLSSAPITLGIADEGFIPQGIAFAFFNIMHVGLALGVMRYKVFNLDRWSYYIWLWLSGMVMIFVLDVLLIRFLQGQPWLSLSVALLIAGFLYFPLRQMLLRLLLHRRSATLQGRMADIVSAALSPTSREHGLRWDALLTDVFAPLAPPEPLSEPVPSPRIEENGLALLIPGIDGLAPRRLYYAQKGRRLFSRDDLEIVANMVQMHDLATESRRAYERGVILERDRISRDVHDNIGAQLLNALHSREVSRKDDLLRDSLSDLRAIINDGFQAEFALQTMLADLRTETAQRLEAHDIALRWTGPADNDADDGPIISFELVNGLRSILREAVSNVLRHSQAGRLEVDIALVGDDITLEIEDDGIGLPPGVIDAGGNGIPNIMDRAQVLMGHARIDNREEGQSGTLIKVTLPLDPDQLRDKAAE
ncbi:ATP-binding protein [Thalassococcus sp. BH17M4-6]|uniref:ATP-binding protein n=1 Tax=Thalassococcus sp. BH17M4-6 TaxID=3413148 RepID=UPI003BF490C0